MRYIGFLPDHKILRRENLHDFVDNEYIDYILLEEIFDQGWPKYTLLNKDGTKRNLRIGKYEVIDMAYSNETYHSNRMVTVIEKDSKKTHTFTMLKKWFNFLNEELLPILYDLHAIGSLDLYFKIKRCKGESQNADECIEQLVNTITEQSKLIAELRMSK